MITGYIFKKSGLTYKKAMRKILEDRLVNLASDVISMRENREKSEISDHLFGQVMRSVTSAALNYGEAQGAESRKDYSHKIGIVLKELRESHNNLKIISNSNIFKGNPQKLEHVLDECNQLIAIFHKTAISLKKKEI
jgi:four helix bundle protein